MKKHIFTLACGLASMAIMTTSCGGGKTESTETSDSTTVSTAASDDTWIQDSIAKTKMTSPDLTYLELHGPVKKVQIDKGFIYELNENGEIVALDCIDPFSQNEMVATPEDYHCVMSRNEDGYISELGGWEWANEYFWKDGKIVREEDFAEADEYEYKYEYNDKGEICKVHSSYGYAGDDERQQELITYIYNKYDAYGNWIQRKSITTDNDGNEESRIEERTIVYYPIERVAGQTDKGDFDPERHTYHFKGSIGMDKDVALEIGPDGGMYQLKSGKRTLRLGIYNSKSKEIRMYAYLGKKQIGMIDATIEDGKLKGLFTNTHTYDKVDVKMELEK